MRMRVFFSAFLSVSFAWLILSSGALMVEADSFPSGGHYLTVQETRDFIGASIPFTYFNGSQYVDAVATYDSSDTCTAETSENPVGFPVGATFLRYRFQANNINSSPNYITFRITPTYSIFDTEYLYTCFAVTKFTAQNVSSSAYQSPNSDWFIGGSNINFANRNETSANSGSYAYLNFQNLNALYVPIVHRQQNTFSAYAVDFEACGGVANLGYFYVMCPYVSGDAFGQSGSFASGSGGGGVVTGTTSGAGGSSVDLTETNGLLGRIEIILSGIVDGIKGLFIPDDEFLSDWVDDMKQLLEDHLGGLYQAVTSLDDFWQQFNNVTAAQEIYIPPCQVPLAGSTLTLGDWHVPLKVVGLPQIFYDGLALIIDFLAVMAFLKMCRNKLEIFLVPESEVVQNDN